MIRRDLHEAHLLFRYIWIGLYTEKVEGERNAEEEEEEEYNNTPQTGEKNVSLYTLHLPS